jgi:hypothetical protein
MAGYNGMTTKRLAIGIGIAALLYAGYRGLSCALRSDEAELRGLVVALEEGFAEGNLRAIQGCLADDFEAVWRRRSYSRADVSDHLRYVFFRGERLVLDGSIASIAVEPEGRAGVAVVLWEGTVTERRGTVGPPGGVLHRGTGELLFRRAGGSWLLARAEALGERRP